MTTYYDEILPAWKHPTLFDSAANFAGEIPEGYSIYSRNRDSSILEQVNFNCILVDLGGEGDHVTVIRHGHWACGYIEYIIVSRSAPESVLDLCVETLRALQDYPVFSDCAYIEAQCEAINNYWTGLLTADRIQLCADNRVSIFASRRNEVPETVYDHLSSTIFV